MKIHVQYVERYEQEERKTNQKKYGTRSTEKEDIQEKTCCGQNTGSSRKGSDEVPVGVQEIHHHTAHTSSHIHAERTD